MKYFTLTFFCLFTFVISSVAQTQIETSELSNLYKSVSFSRISVHDPSVIWDTKSQQFYIFGSHYFGGKSKDLRNWTAVTNYYDKTYDQAFSACPSHKVMRCLPGSSAPEEVMLGSYDAGSFCATYAGVKVGDREPVTSAQWISGDQWAPDVVYNPNMGKYCYYVSLNGDYWASVIVLMTSDNIEGPYTYQGPIVFGGFNGQSYSGKSVDYKKTDLELVLGTQSALPSRYKTSKWGSYYPNCIDPCAFFDEEGELWMAYGSWSGGIFMLKLDKNTGLRDYTYTYSGTGTSPDASAVSDAYFGKKIAGGFYVSGEGPYIQHIGGYYYLFMSYGGFAPDGGYEMRVFRSESPTGPYKDANNISALYTDKYVLNYGKNAATNRGMKLIGAMNKWGNMTVGECAQGHNSACVDEQGRTFLVCHTKFNNGTAGHQVRAYQMYMNKFGWLCTAPFQFYGETVNDDSIASSQPFSANDIQGDYHVIVHPYKLDHSVYAEATPKNIHLSSDGKVTGDFTGTWNYTDEGKSYFQIKLSNIVYNGVVVEQTLENNSAKALCFTAVCNTSGNASCGVPVWGYKLQPKSAIAYNYSLLKEKLFESTAYSSVSKNVRLIYPTLENTTLNWESSDPERISNTGKYNPDSISVNLTLTAILESGNCCWKNAFKARAVKATKIAGDQTSGLVAYYDFDEGVGSTYNQLLPNGGKMAFSPSNKPTVEDDYERFGTVAHQYFGANGKNSYMRIDNPLAAASSDTLTGFSVSLWVKRVDSSNLYDALWAFFNATTAAAEGPRLYFTGNSYVGFNDNAGNWFDLNHPEKKVVTNITSGEWNHVVFTYSEASGYMIYVNGSKYVTANLVYSGSTDTEKMFNRKLVTDFVKSAKYFYLGQGSFWGSAEAYFDDLMIYNRALSATDVRGLYTLLNRVNAFDDGSYAKLVTRIENPTESSNCQMTSSDVFDLMGRKVSSPSRGVYIVGGRKVVFK